MLRRTGVASAAVEFFRFPTDRGWTRDFGPIFVRNEATRRLAVAAFRFTAWAKYPDWRKDARVAERAARALRLPCVRPALGARRIVLEGGAIDVNGRGTLLTTEECLLHESVQVRNPGVSRIEMEAVLRDALGATNVLWLGRGIAGDDTHGHVDDLCRFVNTGTVVLCQERDARDENYAPLQENRERLEGMRLEDGSRIEVVPLPMPSSGSTGNGSPPVTRTSSSQMPPSSFPPSTIRGTGKRWGSSPSSSRTARSSGFMPSTLFGDWGRFIV
jgi:agmatine deiminase